MSRALDRYLESVLAAAGLAPRDEAEVREELMVHLGSLGVEDGKTEKEVVDMLDKEFGKPEELGSQIASAKGRFRTYLKKEGRKLPRNLLIALVIAGLLRWQVVEVFSVKNACMEPVAPAGSHVMVNKLAYRLGEPREGDVVVYRKEGKSFVRMVRAGGPATVQVCETAGGKQEEVRREEVVGRVFLATR